MQTAGRKKSSVGCAWNVKSESCSRHTDVTVQGGAGRRRPASAASTTQHMLQNDPRPELQLPSVIW